MAEPNLDVGQLSENQQIALQTYTSVTNQELPAAIPVLQRSQWNVQVGRVVQKQPSIISYSYSNPRIQIAIAKFFDGDAPDLVEEARAALAAPPQRSTRQETLLNELNTIPRSSSSSQRDAAPRIVPQPDNRNVYKPPFIFSILFTPFNIIYRLFVGSLGLFVHLFPFLPRVLTRLSPRNPSRGPRRNTTGRRPLNPRDTAARFIREFEEEYGSHSLQMFENGYAQAYDLAKKELKYLLVVILSPEHDDTAPFVRETLLSTEVVDFINDPQNNIILWAGSVQDSEAYQVSSALNCTKLPFAALIVHTPQDSSTSMSTIARVAGVLPPSAFVAKLQTAITQQSGDLNRIRATRAAQQASRNLRQEQNSAYERSLAQDRERMRQRREAEAAKLQAEREANLKIEASKRLAHQRDQWKRWRSKQVASEPEADIKEVTRISVRMPSGERVIRRFPPDAGIEELYAFVECHDLLQDEESVLEASQPQDYKHVYSFNLVSPVPRIVYDLGSGGTLGDRIGRSANLIVEPIQDDEDEE
ncbi:MAG: hypothetical protein Q9187_007314 [Circinaria calcarea]